MLAIAQTGQSEAIHSPEACANMVVKLTMPAAWSTAVVWTVADKGGLVAAHDDPGVGAAEEAAAALGRFSTRAASSLSSPLKMASPEQLGVGRIQTARYETKASD